jgi:hypothetical protein
MVEIVLKVENRRCCEGGGFRFISDCGRWAAGGLGRIGRQIQSNDSFPANCDSCKLLLFEQVAGCRWEVADSIME